MSAASLQLFHLCFSDSIRVSLSEDGYNKGINGLAENYEVRPSMSHSSLIGIVRDSLKTASTAALPGVCLLCKLVF